MTGEYPEDRLFSDCRLEGVLYDMSRLEGCRRCEEVGLCVGVCGGEDMTADCEDGLRESR